MFSNLDHILGYLNQVNIGRVRKNDCGDPPVGTRKMPFRCVLHFKRIEDRFLQEFGIALAADPLYDLTEHDITRIAVFLFFAGRKEQFLLAA